MPFISIVLVHAALMRVRVKTEGSCNMKYFKYYILLIVLICAAALYLYMIKAGPSLQQQPVVNARKPTKDKASQSSDFKVSGARRTANYMGYEDTEVSPVLKKYLDFVPQAPGNLLDLGCAWGFAIQQILALEKQAPFLKPRNRKIIAIDMSQEHINLVSARTPAELVETLTMHFPNIESQKCREAFSPDTLGATFAGLVFHYLNPDELTRGLKLLFDATAPGGRVYASVNSAFIMPALLEDFQRRKKNPADKYPGWYPNFNDNSVPEKIRSTMPKSICGIKIALLHVFDEETLSRYFKQAGFHVIEHFYFNRSKVIPMKLLGIVAEKESVSFLKK